MSLPRTKRLRTRRSAAQRLPAAGPEREALRAKGQFWTPEWVAQAMVAYVVEGGGRTVFDPAVGTGAFLQAGKSLQPVIGRAVRFAGREVDAGVLEAGHGLGLSREDLAGVELRDFLRDPPTQAFPAIVANPPYIRHHRLPTALKRDLRAFGASLLGAPLDGRAGLHVYFLLRALTLLGPGGRLAFIVPADTCEGISADRLWQWIAGRYRLDAVITFSPEASPFPGVDTNSVVLMIRNAGATSTFRWARCKTAGSDALLRWVLSGFARAPDASLEVLVRELAEGLATGLTRPATSSPADGPTLGEFAIVMRGIATGANDFFHLTEARARSLGIPPQFLLPAVARTRDVPGDVLDDQTLEALAATGRPTLLLCLDGRPRSRFPAAVQAYLDEGERRGLPHRPLIATRRPWYRMEERRPPPILFAYLGRRNARFIANRAQAVPLTGFLCVYPRQDRCARVEDLWEVLSDAQTLANLPLVGKSYGGGAIKVEPRALERLRLPEEVVRRVGLRPVDGGLQPVLPLD